MHCFTGDDSVNDYRYLTSLVHHFGAHIIHGGYLSVWHLSLDHGLPTVKIVSSFCDHVIFLIIIHIRFPIHWPWNCTCHRHVSGGHHGYKFDGEWTASTIGFRAITLLLASNVRQNIGRVIPLCLLLTSNMRQNIGRVIPLCLLLTSNVRQNIGRVIPLCLLLTSNVRQNIGRVIPLCLLLTSNVRQTLVGWYPYVYSLHLMCAKTLVGWYPYGRERTLLNMLSVGRGHDDIHY
jgi:uncharacterized membrane protein